MKDTSIGRNVMVDCLAAHTAAAVSSDPDVDWLRFILKRGFIGYEHMSALQLRNELERCGLMKIFFDDEEDSPEPMVDSDTIDEFTGSATQRGA